jgi:hypothetical protein
MIDELEMDLKGNSHCSFSVIYRHLPEGIEELHKTTVRIASILADIRTKHLPDTSLQRYRYTKALSA